MSTCEYQDVPGDPAIRVCVVHNPDFGLYGDEFCAQVRFDFGPDATCDDDEENSC